MIATYCAWLIAAVATAGVVIRPFGWPEAIWACAGALLVVLIGVLSPADAMGGIVKGADVYLFLLGMMLLAETARREGLFDWLAALATRLARGSALRLFLLVYVVGVVVTVFLSNDATAVVMTPAVAAAARTAKVEEKLPFLLICAFVANAASFVLPISNPANLVVYASHMPALLPWLLRFGLPSAGAIAATYLALLATQRGALTQKIAADVDLPALSASGKIAALGIVATALVLLAASAMDLQLGLPTAIAGATTAGVVLLRERSAIAAFLKPISWGVLPLVAGLFVLVEMLDKTGVVSAVAALLQQVQSNATAGAAGAGTISAVVSNLMNNLPAGLIAADAVQRAQSPDKVVSAVLIGIDIGPNLSVTGSLATILWLSALKREGEHVSCAAFLRVGAIAMPAALAVALGLLLLSP